MNKTCRILLCVGAGAMLVVAGLPARAEGAVNGFGTEIGGLKAGFSATSHQGPKDMFLTVIRGGKAVQVDKL